MGLVLCRTTCALFIDSQSVIHLDKNRTFQTPCFSGQETFQQLWSDLRGSCRLLNQEHSLCRHSSCRRTHMLHSLQCRRNSLFHVLQMVFLQVMENHSLSDAIRQNPVFISSGSVTQPHVLILHEEIHFAFF